MENVKQEPRIINGRFEGTYWQWIRTQLSGWDNFPWALFGIGFGFQLAVYILNPITWMTTISFIATAFGELCTVAMGAGGINVLTGKRMFSHSINGLFGSISVIGFIIVNAAAGHWWSCLDQLCFFFLIDLELLLTWRTWGYGDDEDNARKLTKKGWIGVIIAILVAWCVLYFVGATLHDTNPIFDSLTLSIGATASWLCFRRYSTTYTLWLISDVINICLWATTLNQGLTPASLSMLTMTVFYFATAVMGKINWRPYKK